MSRPVVSVLMLTFNRPQFLDRAIESILTQTLREWELIVVHDGPNEQIAGIMEQWSKRDPRVRYHRRREPGNIAQATNFGLAQSRGDYIAILDDDDRWSVPDKLERQVAFLSGHPEYMACGGGVIVVDQHGTESLRYLKPEHHDQIRRQALLANPMAHSTVMFRRSAIEQCGGYDGSLAGFQDWDVCLKLGRLGKLYNFQDYFLDYTIWEGGGSFAQQRKNTRSALTIVCRHRKAYAGFPMAFTLALLYHAYGYMPVFIRKSTFGFLSRLKKSIFSGRAARAAG